MVRIRTARGQEKIAKKIKFLDESGCLGRMVRGRVSTDLMLAQGTKR